MGERLLMNASGTRTDGRRFLRGVIVASVLGLSGLLLGACGSSSPSGGVASLGRSPGTTTALAAAAGNSGSPPSPALQKAQLAYSKCMRAHGVENFPDPNVGGGYPTGYMHKIDPQSSQYRAAMKGCEHLASKAQMAPWTKAQMEAHDAAMLKIAVCMRAHGVTNFPDPDASGGFSMPAGGAGALDMSSPQYEAAAKKCNGPPGGRPQGGSNARSP